MRILHIINDLSVGGAQKMVHDLVLIQHSDPSIQVRICTFKKTESKIELDLRQANIDIISFPTSHSIVSIKKLAKEMKWADVVHVHLFPANYLAAIANTIAQKPMIFTEHSTHNKRRNHKFLRPVEQFIYRHYRHVACISQATKSNLSLWIGSKIANPRLVVIENGIDTDKYSDAISSNPQVIFGRPGIPLLMISRLSPAKDHPTVIRALKHLNNKIFAVFAGEGERRAELESLAKELHVDERVIFLGTRNDIPQLIKSSLIGIQSSLWEGFGLTAVEIMAGGIPLVASDVEGLKEIVAGAALLFPPSDDKALAQIIKKLLDNPSLYKKCVENGINKAIQYSIHSTAKKYEKLYRELTF